MLASEPWPPLVEFPEWAPASNSVHCEVGKAGNGVKTVLPPFLSLD